MIDREDRPLAEADVQSAVLSEVLVTVPYNSATQIREYFAEQHVPERLGMSCAWQSFLVGRRVHERTGRAPTYLRDGRHVAVVYRDADRLAVLDPYLLHRVPLRFDRGDEKDGVVRSTVDAYPVRRRSDGQPAPGRLRGAWDTRTGTIQLDYLRYSVRRGHNVLSRSFTLRPEAVLAQAPSPPEFVRKQLLHPEQNNLSVRTVHPTAQLLAELVLPLAGLSASNPPSFAHFITKDNDGRVSRAGSDSFDRDLELVADAVELRPAEVADFLLDTARLYIEVAPSDRELPAYSLDDE